METSRPCGFTNPGPRERRGVADRPAGGFHWAKPSIAYVDTDNEEQNDHCLVKPRFNVFELMRQEKMATRALAGLATREEYCAFSASFLAVKDLEGPRPKKCTLAGLASREE